MGATRDEKLEAVARACHEANRAYCESIGDRSQPSWDDAPDWQRSSAVNGVEGVLAGNGARESHESWLRQKVEDGWVYGTTKDAGAKTHPCMIPYGDLPREQKFKDIIFVSTARRVAAEVGLEGHIDAQERAVFLMMRGGTLGYRMGDGIVSGVTLGEVPLRDETGKVIGTAEMMADGSAVVRVTDPVALEALPSWFPAGQRNGDASPPVPDPPAADEGHARPTCRGCEHRGTDSAGDAVWPLCLHPAWDDQPDGGGRMQDDGDDPFNPVIPAWCPLPASDRPGSAKVGLEGPGGE